MIAFIKGKLNHTDENLVIIESNNIGFELITSSATASKLNQLSGEILVYTYMHVREDAITLFGFYDIQEKNMFQKLITVSGVGPRLAITALSGISPTELAVAILTGDISTLSSVKGIGKRTAEKIIVELREKVGKLEDNFVQKSYEKITGLNQEIEDAAFALTALGINKSEAVKLVLKVAKEGMSAEDIIKTTLKTMGK